MANRHLSRSIVLQSLFEWDFSGKPEDLKSIVDRNVFEFAPGHSDNEFMYNLAETVQRKQTVIDDIITKAAPEWPLEKIGNVDRSVLRMGLAELIFGDREQVPPKVAINEAIELAKTFGGENSGKFVNGVLGAVYKELGEPGKDQQSKQKAKKPGIFDEEDLSKIPINKKAGAVVYCIKDNQVYVALVHDVFGYWTLSKGSVEGSESLEEGAIDKAKAIFSYILTKNKDYHKASCKMAMCYSAEGENELAKEAINDFIKKIEILKEHNILINGNGEVPLEAFSTRGIIHRRLKNVDEAIKTFTSIEEAGGKLPKSLYTHLGYSYMYKGDVDNYDKAIACFKMGARIDKSSPSFYGLVKADTLKNKKVDMKLLEEAIILSNKDTLENKLYPYHHFGSAFLLMLQNEEGNSCLRQLKYSLEICRNLGTLKEQLYEYELFKANSLEFYYLEDSINELNSRINEVESKLRAAKYLLEKKYS